jgi:DNA-binding helix-hairpin-helix protein with protein kinase domain
MTEVLLAKSKTPIRIGVELARGGEGAVHLLPDAADKLLKLYLKPQSGEKVRKLQIMTAGGSEALAKVAAWPLELVTDRQDRVLGFIMPRAASSTQAHELYTPKSRAQTFPEEDFRFLLHVATNIVRAFGTLHQAGYVIGDVNHGQVLVGRDGRVTLIDCDSIQVQANGQLYTCDVGVPLFTGRRSADFAGRSIMTGSVWPSCSFSSSSWVGIPTRAFP